MAGIHERERGSAVRVAVAPRGRHQEQRCEHHDQESPSALAGMHSRHTGSVDLGTDHRQTHRAHFGVSQLDLSCFTGEYVTSTVTEEYLGWVERTQLS